MGLFGKKEPRSFILISGTQSNPKGSILMTMMDAEKIRNYIINSYRDALISTAGIDISKAKMIGIADWNCPLAAGGEKFALERMGLTKFAREYLEANEKGVKKGSSMLTFSCINTDLMAALTFVQIC